MDRHKTFEKKSEAIWGGLFILPALTLLIIFMFVPIAEVFYYSLTDWNGMTSAHLVGLENYRKIFTNPDFYTVLKNNLVILVLGVPLWTVFPFLIATFLYEEIPGHRFFKTVYFFPSVLSIVIVGTIFKSFFGYTGPINSILRSLGLGQYAINWFAHGSTSLPIIVSAVNWAGFGSAVLIYLAGMSAIDSGIYEAARLDGATWWQKTRFITVPLTKNVIEFTIVLNIIHAFSQMFSYVLVMTGGGPGYESTVLEYFIYLRGFRAGEMGYAAALSVILFGIVLLISVLQAHLTKEKG